MATRAKYTRAKPENDTNEAKADTDILMRFSERYGISFLTQASTSPEPSLSSSEKASPSSPSRLPKSLWTRPSGSLKSFAERSRDST